MNKAPNLMLHIYTQELQTNSRVRSGQKAFPERAENDETDWNNGDWNNRGGWMLHRASYSGTHKRAGLGIKNISGGCPMEFHQFICPSIYAFAVDVQFVVSRWYALWLRLFGRARLGECVRKAC
jgi:hypothetical protein